MTKRATRTLPGALTRRDADLSIGEWEVRNGRPARGDAWTDPVAHKMRVPGGNNDMAKIIRAHEMMHAKCSPTVAPWVSDLGLMQVTDELYDMELIHSCEELRTNKLLTLVDPPYDLDELCDGSERESGERLSNTMFDWNAAVYFAVATHGGRAQRLFIEGVKKSQPAMAKLLLELKVELRAEIRAIDGTKSRSARALEWGNTQPYVWGGTSCWAVVNPVDTTIIELCVLPRGYVTIVPRLLRVATKYLRHDPTLGDDTLDPKEVHAAKTGKGPAPALATVNGESGWQNLNLDDTLPLDVKVSGMAVGKKRVPAPRGCRVAYVNRIVTDPQKRIFGGTSSKGRGVMVVDMSGSMSLSSEDIVTLLDLAPNLTIIGYSGGQHADFNAWILARDGRRVSKVPSGNGNNWCDLPALQYAQDALRLGSEPLIWVSDGAVVKPGSNGVSGKEEVAKFVRQHHVYQVLNVKQAVDAFRYKRSQLRNTHVPSASRISRHFAAEMADVHDGDA